ncbi:ATP synthase subunit I [Niallia sp. FSL W8-0635]|uniref:ATP synthase subunit I n=1 Tax=Niallia sp. FSL W8-0635 TaxID=2975337 RepID=UPI0009D62260|nr:ATP synthase I chain [Mycobacteroides abscessus subsp. abscessus]
MEQLFEIYMRVKKYLYFFLSFCAFAWAFTPYQSVFLGLFVGTSASVFNLTLLVRRAKVFDKAIEDEGKVYGLGTLSRMATAVIVCLIAVEYPQKVHLISVVIGLMTAYIVIMADYLVRYFILHKNGEKRGE